MWPKNHIGKLFGVDFPIIQGGMVWVSGAKLAAAVSEAGGLGLIGAGSMKPDLLRSHLIKTKQLTQKPFGVNLPLLYEGVEAQIQTALEEGVRIFFTSAGSPKKWTGRLKNEGCKVVHVASSVSLALKCQDAGVDAVVLEGFEAGGHNGRDELTTLVLMQQASGALHVPVIAAGGIFTGAAIHAAFALGAAGVQLGTRFAATLESSAHQNFKQSMCDSAENATFLRLKKSVPVRLMHNAFSMRIAEAEARGATTDELHELLGKGRARKGMLEGDVHEGELEIGQVVSLVDKIESCKDVMIKLVDEYQASWKRFCEP